MTTKFKTKTKNGFFSLLLVLVMLVGMIPVSSLATLAGDTVCEECEYTSNGFCVACGGYQPAYDITYMNKLVGVSALGVANAGQLYWAAEYCDTVQSLSIWLLNDITVNVGVLNMVNDGRGSELMEWTPIGNSTSYAYTQTIYGNGHTISGLYVSADSDNDYVGLIGLASSGAKVQNLRITDSYFASTGSEVGAFCGRSSGGVYIDCYNEATVVSNSFSAGGIVGQSACDIFTRCGNGGIIEVAGQPESVVIGGITATAAARLVTGNYATAQTEFDKCFNIGTFKYNGSSEFLYVGSITGQTFFGKYTNCYYDSSKCSNVYGAAAQATEGEARMDPTITDCEGISDESQFRNGSVCEKIGHLYFDGECVICDNKCSGHSFSGTSCSECGMGIIMVTGLDADLPANVVEGESLALTATVYPSNASYRDVTWSVVSGDAAISNNTVTFNKMGTVVLKATVKNGLKVGSDYSRSFSVIVRSTSIYNINQVSGTTSDYRMTITESGGKLAIQFDRQTYYVDLGTQIVVTGFKTESDSSFGITVKDTSEAVNLTLKDCAIKSTSDAIEIKNAALNLTLEGSSSLESNQSAIWVISSASIVIDGTGSLKAQSTGSYPAIGSSYANISGDITINGGTVTAIGGTSSAGIGGYYGTSAGNITINGGNVTATGGTGKTDIVGGGAGIGGGAYASGGTITINGGTVNATGGNAFVGSNTNSTGGAAGIGGGYNGRSGNITINGGAVTSTGSAYGAGIGSGQAESTNGNSLIDTIKITGGTIIAKGINLGSGIGGGMRAYGGNIIITGGNINAYSERGTAIGKGANSPRDTNTSVTDGNGNSVSKITYAIDGLTAVASVAAITGCEYGVNDVSTLDTNKLYFYLPSGANVDTVTTQDGEYICQSNNTFYKDHEYSADCDEICNHCGKHRVVSVAHDYENGVCKNCGAYSSAVFNESKGYYEIYDANQLFWFADEVNSGETTINGKLMADIDASSLASFGIGSSSNKYAGTFDGNGYTLTVALDSAEQFTAPFAYVNGASIKNLTVTGSVTSSQKYAASLVGQAEGDVTIEKCLSDVVITSTVSGDGTHGGLVGVVNSGTLNINNCGFTGQINGSSTYSCGGLVGWSNGTTNIINSFVAATFDVSATYGNTFSRGDNITLTNCYYLNELNSTPDGATQKDEDAFNSGEVTYMLNDGVTDGTQVWYQTLTGDEKQSYPSFSGKTVYSSNGQYVNAQIITVTGVTAEDGVYSGSSHTGYTGTPTNADGYTDSYEVKYVGRNGTTYSSTEAPTNIGDYTVIISTDSGNAQYIGSVSLDFTIAKKDVTVTAATQKINKGESLSTDKVTVGTLLEGHTASVSAVTKGANCKYTATVVIKDGNNNDVTANYSFDATGTYHEYDWDTATHQHKCLSCSDYDNTDSDMPTAEYKIGTSGFKKFISTITFGLFCKDYKTVEITSKDDTSGVKITQYYISGKELSKTELADVTWSNYTDKLSLNAKGTYFIYVKVTDNAGNSAIYNSEGVVIFEDSTASVEIEYTRTTNTDVKANIDFNGNTVKEVKYGTSVLTKGTDYTVTNDGITFTATFLKTLAASDSAYTVTVSYNAGGVEWDDESVYQDKPIDTVIAITVKLATGSVTNIEDVSKTYDGDAVSNPTYTSLSTGNATYEYKVKGADDNEYTTVAPKNVGNYTVRVTVAADTNYKEAFATADFNISNADLTDVSVEQSGSLTYTGNPQTATVTTKATAKGNQKVTFTYSDKENGTYTESVPAFTTKGTYRVYYKAAADNHNTASGQFDVIISAANNNWTTAPSISGWTYGETANTPTVKAKFGDVNITYTGTANDGSDYNSTTAPTKAGTYKAVFTVTATDNYSGLAKEVPFTIAKAPITVTADNAEKTYGDSDPTTFTWKKTSGTLYNGDELTGISVTRVSGEKADTYAIKATASKDANPNYDITFADGTFTINKAVLTATADNKTATYGDAVPTYTVNYNGFKNGETDAVLGGTLAFDCNYAQFSDKGDYVIIPKGLASDNYTFDYRNGTLSVSAKEITVAIIGKTSIYGDEIKTLTATDNGIVNGDTNVYRLSTTASKTSGIGTYDITGTALDDNYSITFAGGENAYEITKRNLTVTVEVNNKQYDGLNTASIKSVKLNNVANNDSITLVNGTPTFTSVNVANGIGIAFTEFSLSGAADVLNNYTLTQPTGITANITNGWNPVKDTEYNTSTPNTNGWLNADLVITAKDGYELSFANTADGTWENTLSGATEGADSSLKFYVRNKATDAISEQVTVNYKLDKNTETTGTTGKVEFVGRSNWQTFVNNITFGLFYKDEVTVKAEATDKLSGVDSIEYAVSDKALTLEEVKAITDWTAMPQDGVGVTIEDQKTFVYFIRITDKAGNVNYLSTDGAEYDTTLPAIDGIENGGIYHTTKVITVTDKNLESVALNSEPVTLGSDGKLTLIGNIEETYTITVTDKAGNVTEYTVTMKATADIADSIKDITADDVTGDDRESIETVIKDIEEELKNDGLTDEEKAELENEKHKAEALIEKIEEAAGSTDTDNTDKVKDITTDNVEIGDKSDLEKAKDDLEKALEDYKDNLTDDEKKDIEKEIERIEDALDVIEKVEDVEDLINKLPDTITKGDTDAIKKADDAYNALSEYEQSILNKDAKKKLDNAKSALEALNKATVSPTTGDNSHIWLWFALLFVSGGGILGTTVCRRKRKETEN